ncbi:pentatricopeptide repeat-containing protein At4g36680, mitochondrial [Prosopis cineraria]|uniref:pentatricopeptide repeat-containing protein At4g36680, mitochondrial n=1 Tax=Prosopis cineraria TaxID=364024 RepID=UPI00240F5324|nr:pentatricopeptide repeat-containing protein At4g36680, mitochondrial [Prosopis cineraria]
MSHKAAMIRRICHFSTTFCTSISEAKSKLRPEYDPDEALKLFSSVSKKFASPESSRHAQDLTVRCLAKSGRFSDVENLIESRKNDPEVTQEPFLSILIRSYGRAGMFDHALNTYNQMDDLGTPRSALSFNTLLSACVESKLFGKVPLLFEEIPKKYGVVPDKISYGILVKSFCEVSKPEEALELVKEADKKGMEITVVTYTTILDAFYRKGKSDEAEKLWNLMAKKGCMDAAAYNVRLMFEQKGKPEDVKATIDEMTNAGIKADTITYNYLMTCYLKSGMVDEAMVVYKGLRDNGCKPNATTFKSLVYHLCRNGYCEAGYKVFKKSVEMHKIPDFNTLKILAEGLVNKGRKKEAKGLVRTMKKKFPPHMLKAWGKVEKDLNLTPPSAESDEAEKALA